METAKQPLSGCIKCRRDWPNATFRSEAEAVGRGEDPRFIQHICDLCLEFAPDEISQAIDEAQGEGVNKPTNQGLRRLVHVEGIESKANVIWFSYCTHYGSTPRAFTDLHVGFKGDKQYAYFDVPVAVCEGWYVAPSKGSYFAEMIKSSYRCEKVK